jgi:hypothetical protein
MNVVHLIQRKYLTVGSQLKVLDFAELAQYLTLDIITCLSLGEPFGFVSEDTDKYRYIKSIENNFPIINIFSAVPILSAIMRIPTVQNNLIPTVKDQTGLGKAKALVHQLKRPFSMLTAHLESREILLPAASAVKSMIAMTW